MYLIAWGNWDVQKYSGSKELMHSMKISHFFCDLYQTHGMLLQQRPFFVWKPVDPKAHNAHVLNLANIH
jgi:hypothetical protein